MIVLVGLLVTSLINTEPMLVRTNKELESLNKKIAEVKQSASERERLGDYLRSDSYLERQARLKLNYKNPDESVVYVYSKDARVIEMARTGGSVSKILESKLMVSLKSWWGYLIK